MSFLHSWLLKQNGGQCDWVYGKLNELGGPVILGNPKLINEEICHRKDNCKMRPKGTIITRPASTS